MTLKPSGDPFIGEMCKKLSNECNNDHFVFRRVADKKLSPFTQPT